MTHDHKYSIPEERSDGLGRLGRGVWHDPRSLDYEAQTARRLKPVLHEPGPGTVLPLDQASVGSCTTEALCAALSCAPDFHGRVFTQDDAYTGYSRETANEGEPWPPNDPGGSGLAACKAGKQLGWLKSYRHAFGLTAALKALVLRPNIWGMNWYDTFDHPDPATGIVTITPDAFIRGGHEVCATEIILDKELIGFWNSWGRWGLNGTGRFYMSFSTAERLLAEEGDVTVPMPL